MVNEAGDAQAALRFTQNQSLDMGILDIDLQGRSGTDFLGDLKRASANLRILVQSMFPEEHNAVRIFQSGGNDYFKKNADLKEVVHAVKMILDGEEHVSETVAQQFH